jgi:hypothetical protein
MAFCFYHGMGEIREMANFYCCWFKKVCHGQEFWIKEISQSLLDPSTLEQYADRHDRCYAQKTTVFGTIVLSIGPLGMLH